MTARFFCSTNLCTYQAAQLCHAQQREAALRAQLAAVTAERDALAVQVAQAQEAQQESAASADFYMDLFLSEKEVNKWR